MNKIKQSEGWFNELLNLGYTPDQIGNPCLLAFEYEGLADVESDLINRFGIPVHNNIYVIASFNEYTGNWIYINTKSKNKITPRLTSANKYKSDNKAYELFHKLGCNQFWQVKQLTNLVSVS